MRPLDAELPSPNDRLGGDRGAALIETALVAPVLILIVFGIFEFGLLYRDMLTVNDATGDGARSGGIVGNTVYGNAPFGGENADWFIVSAIRQGTASLDRDDITRIVVFQPNQADPTRFSAIDLVPAACKTATTSVPASRCNVYDPIAAFGAIERGTTEYFQCGGAYTVACGYDPASKTLRNSTPGGGNQANRYVGVYVEYEHATISGFFGTDFTIKEAAIALIEPYDPEDV